MSGGRSTLSMIRVVVAAAANINDDATVDAFIIAAAGVWAIRVEYC